jgi:hypothetical protein
MAFQIRASGAQSLTTEAVWERVAANIPFQVTVHDSEEDLQKEVDGVDKHRQQEQPSFSGHHLGLKCVWTTLRVGDRVKLRMTMLVKDKDS